ncbi:MAG: cytochrome c-type biogenesis protein CcmH [Dokdonella sp.]|nr:cytochrome c-type biogenesis protein CcmH [Dokdonella sp.]
MIARLRPLALAALIALAPAAHAIDPLPFTDVAQEQRFQQLTRQLRCLVCQNENLADSHAPLAQDLRQQVFEQMQAGKSDEEIKRWLTDRYSDFVLYDPPLRGGTVVLWFGPAVVLAIGLFAVVTIVRRRSRALGAATSTRPPDGDDW